MTIEIKDNIFREYDIRGKYPGELSKDVARCLASAYAKLLKEKSKKDPLTVTIGRDVRTSSTEIKDVLATTLSNAGINVIDIGECPTPLQYFSLFTLDADGGIMITGSHNPPEYNGFKISVGKETIHGKEIQAFKEMVKAAAKETPAAAATKGKVSTINIIEKYTAFHVEKFGPILKSLGLKKPLKIVVDAGNGTGGLVAPKLLEKLGIEVTSLFCEPDGTFPNHHPDPTVPENLEHLITEVKKQGADFGIGYDGDSDRIGVVDEKGAIVWGDQLMIIYAKDILKTTKNATIVGEVKCSQVMYDEIRKSGGNAVMWKTGHSLIKSKMKELKASMAGEMSGHIFFADRYFGFDDAVYASCRIAEIFAKLKAENPSAVFSDLLKGLPKTFVTPEYRVDCPDSEKFGVIEKIKAGLKNDPPKDLSIREIIDIDGLRIIFDNGWALMRASNTQPVLVLRYEATDEASIEKFKGFVRARIKQAWSGFKG
ncbi:MAG: phosphomannomutase/phosphoglucomutase [Deltaproteobacteria bacterium]|nr:phosphomannomutase/phosphoglucomutase [Deltaproteobacteria bacterium]